MILSITNKETRRYQKYLLVLIGKSSHILIEVKINEKKKMKQEGYNTEMEYITMGNQNLTD